MKKLIGLTLLLGFLLASCSAPVRLTVLRPAELDTTGIQKIAIGPFEVMMLEEVQQTERNGNWQRHVIPLSPAQKQAIAKQIRAQVIANLAETPYFELVYTDEFEKLGTAERLAETVGAAGYKTKEAQAVLSGKVWIQLTKTDGANPKKQTLQFVSGGRNSFAVSVDKVIWWPYKSLRGTLSLELRLLRTRPTEVMAVSTETREFSHRIGGEPLDFADALTSGSQNLLEGSESQSTSSIESSDEVLPSFEQTIAELSGSIASNFIRKVSVSTAHVLRRVSTGGDQRAKMLIQAGAYQMAIDRLQTLTANKPDPDDLFNLGLSFEALGEYGLARLNYQEALKFEDDRLLYAQGLGRVEKALQSKASLRDQLKDKEKR